MTILNKTFAATAATFLTLSGVAFADGHSSELNVGQARLDTALDTDGDGEVSDDEIIDANEAMFDVNGSGTIDASERNQAERLLMTGSVITTEMAMAAAVQSGMMVEFDVGSARLDTSLDTDGDGEVSDDEIIDGNEMLFDTDGSGTINASERNVAEQLLRTGGSTISIDASTMAGAEQSNAAVDFNVGQARLNTALDTNGDGEVDDNEIIDGNMGIFDTNNDGSIDASERSMAEEMLMNN